MKHLCPKSAIKEHENIFKHYSKIIVSATPIPSHHPSGAGLKGGSEIKYKRVFSGETLIPPRFRGHNEG